MPKESKSSDKTQPIMRIKNPKKLVDEVMEYRLQHDPRLKNIKDKKKSKPKSKE